MKIYDSSMTPPERPIVTRKPGYSQRDYMLTVNTGADLGGGTLQLVLEDADGVEHYTDELTFTSAPPATVVSLAAGWTITATLTGATGADLQVYLSEM